MSAPIRVHEAFGLNSQEQQLLWFDDFLGDSLDDRFTSTIVGGGATAVIDAQTGGIVRISTGATLGDSAELNWGDIRSLRVDDRVCIEARVKLSHTTNIDSRIVGLRKDGNEQILFFIDTNSDPRIGILVQNVGTTIAYITAPDTNYHVYRIEADSSQVLSYIDDVLVDTTTTNIPTGDFLQPEFFCRARASADRNIEVDYVVVRQER